MKKEVIGLIGEGFVGGALKKSFEEKGIEIISFDKYKKIGSIESCITSKICFLCLPTPFLKDKGYDLSSIEETIIELKKRNYDGLLVLKSTVEVGTTKKLYEKYEIPIVHNPEFLTERTAYEDFHSQEHIVIGYESSIDYKENLKCLLDLYKNNYSTAEITLCASKESEAMKIFCNSFYAAKIMIFNELYDFCIKNNFSYENTLSIMLKNNWINPMHTLVPGPDGKIAYGGNCFCKDTNALLLKMKEVGSINEVFSSVIKERNSLRDDNPNIK